MCHISSLTEKSGCCSTLLVDVSHIRNGKTLYSGYDLIIKSVPLPAGHSDNVMQLRMASSLILAKLMLAVDMLATLTSSDKVNQVRSGVKRGHGLNTGMLIFRYTVGTVREGHRFAYW